MPVPNPALISAANSRPQLDLNKITGGMQPHEILFEINRGARFIVYQYVVSALVITLRRNSAVQFVRAGESAAMKSLPYSSLSLLLGWWGFPWGLIRSPQTIYGNLKGGADITALVVSRLQAQPYSISSH